jgi:DNA replication protein DnaC
MERTEILELMSTLKLFGMRAAYDEVMASGIKRRHEPPRIVGDLLSAEIAEKQARSIKYQLTIAKLPLAKKSTTSTSPARRSTRPWSAIWRAAGSSPSSATPS